VQLASEIFTKTYSRWIIVLHAEHKTSKTEMQREKREKKTKQNIPELWDNYKRCNIYVTGIPEGAEIFEAIMTENFPKFMIDTYPTLSLVQSL